MSNTNNFSLTGIGSSVRFGKGNGIIAFGTGGFGVFDITGTTLTPLSVGSATSANHAMTRSQVYSLVGSTALTGANGINFSNGTISALIDGSTIVLNGTNLSVGQITNSNVASGANIALSKLAALATGSVLVSDSNGVISTSGVSSTTLGYLDATSSIQTQFNSIGTTYLPLSGGTVTGPIISTAVPTLGSQLVNKSYVDGIGAGIDAKQAVAAATTGSNILLDGSVTTLDGVSLTNGMRVLVKDQTTQTQNGIYIVSSTAWQRSTDFATGNDESGAYTFVTAGTANHGKGYVVVGTPNVVGTNNITFTQFSEAGAYTAGSGLSINTSGVPAIFSINLGSASGLTTSTGPLNLNIASLNAGGTISTADLIALSQAGSTVYTTVGSLAAEIAQSSVTGTGAITVNSGVVSLVTDGEFTQTGGSLALGDITPTSLTTTGTATIGDTTINGDLNVNGPDGLVVSSDITATEGTFSGNLYVGNDLLVTGNISGSNLSGVNTGDNTAGAGIAIIGSGGAISAVLDGTTLAFAGGSAPGAAIMATGSFNSAINATGTIAASNFSGASSGVNTGDQTAGNALSLTGSRFDVLYDNTTIQASGGTGALFATGTFAGNIAASNFSGSSSGINTGDVFAGNGLSNSGGSFNVNVDGSTITNTGSLAVQVDNSTIIATGTGLSVNLLSAGGIGTFGSDGLILNILNLPGGTQALNGTMSMLVDDSGPKQYTLSDLAAFFADDGVTGTGAIVVSNGTVSLATDGEFTQTGGLLALGNITPTNIDTAGTIGINAGQFVLFNGSADTNWRMGIAGTSGTSLATRTIGSTTSLQIVTGAGTGPDGFAIGNTNGSSWFEVNGSTGVVSILENVTAANLSGTNTGDQTITISGDATGTGTGAITLTLGTSGVTAGTYGDSSHYATFTVDAKGRLTQAGTVSISSLGTGSVTSIVTGTGLTGGTITNTGTIAMGTSGVTAGTYTLPTITVDALGRTTSASSATIGNGLSFSSGTLSTVVSPIGGLIQFNSPYAGIGINNDSSLAINTYGTVSVLSVHTHTNGGIFSEAQHGDGLFISIANLNVGTGLSSSDLIAVSQGNVFGSGDPAYAVQTTLGSVAAFIGSNAVSGTGAITATGGVIALVTDGEFTQTSGTLALGTSGVTAGTYNQIVVNSKGIVTSGTTVATAYATALRTTFGSAAGTSVSIGTLQTIGTFHTVVAKVVMNIGTAFTGATVASVTDGTNTYMMTSENDITTPGTYVAELPMTLNSEGKVLNVVFDSAPTAGTGTVTVKYDLI